MCPAAATRPPSSSLLQVRHLLRGDRASRPPRPARRSAGTARRGQPAGRRRRTRGSVGRRGSGFRRPRTRTRSPPGTGEPETGAAWSADDDARPPGGTQRNRSAGARSGGRLAHRAGRLSLRHRYGTGIQPRRSPPASVGAAARPGAAAPARAGRSCDRPSLAAATPGVPAGWPGCSGLGSCSAAT